MDAVKLQQLKQFINTCKSDPSILSDPSLSFFCDYLESIGAKLPLSAYKSESAKAKGMEAISDGKLEEAIEHLTEAILLNPTSAIMYATRATVYIKMKKPNAAIRDADAALKINPDSAKGYKSRGIARSLLGQWEEAAKDLHVASNIDFDEEIKLKQFINTCKSDPSILSDPSLSFFRDYLESIGAKLPSSAYKSESNPYVVEESDEEMGDSSVEVSEENRDASQEAKAKGMEAISDATVYIKMKKPNAAIRDADAALKVVLMKYDKLRKEREDRKTERERQRRKAEAKAAYEKAKKEEKASSSERARGGPAAGGFPGGGMPSMPGGGSGGGGGMPGGIDYSKILNDPELMAAFQDPEVMAALQDVMQNPANLAKHQANPKVAPLIAKMMSKFGGPK
nr:hypothetical protein [Tanacetum cinerariifolium]